MTDQYPLTIAQWFADMDDARRDQRKRHRIIEISSIALGWVICGTDSWGEVEAWGHAKLPFLCTFLEIPHGISSHDTFGRVFALLTVGGVSNNPGAGRPYRQTIGQSSRDTG